MMYFVVELTSGRLMMNIFINSLTTFGITYWTHPWAYLQNVFERGVTEKTKPNMSGTVPWTGIPD